MVKSRSHRGVKSTVVVERDSLVGSIDGFHFGSVFAREIVSQTLGSFLLRCEKSHGMSEVNGSNRKAFFLREKKHVDAYTHTCFMQIEMKFG